MKSIKIMMPLIIGTASFSAACIAKAEVTENRVFSPIAPNVITTDGWLEEFLIRQKDGLGSVPEVSGYPFNTDMWKADIFIPHGHYGDDWWPYEQTAYYLDGITRLGYLIEDDALLDRAKDNFTSVLNTWQPDDVMGPKNAGDWSRVVFFRALMAEYEATHDRSILDALSRHYLENKRDMSSGRALLNIEIMLWLYQQTGIPELLHHAEATFGAVQQASEGGEYTESDLQDVSMTKQNGTSLLAQMLSDDIPSGHGVTWCENMKIPAILYIYTGKQEYLDASVNATEKLIKHHLLVDGCPSAVEHLHGNAADSAHETCDVIDLSWSLTYLLMATGEVRWADMIEKAIFNAGIGSISKDFTGHQYYSAPNQSVAAESSSHFNQESWGGISRGRLCYKPGHDTECCTGNIQRMMPIFANRMWMKTQNEGIAATLYGPSATTILIGPKATPVTIEQQTVYPFSETIDFVVTSDESISFPLKLRVPAWCEEATLKINGKPHAADLKSGEFYTLDRVFANKDVITLTLPMQVKAVNSPEGGVALERGPLAYSLPISAKVAKYTSIGCKRISEFPDLLLYPEQAWNYALQIDTNDLDSSIEVVHTAPDGYPWDANYTPTKLRVRAQKVTNWQLDGVKHTPIWPTQMELDAEVETLELVPLGATYLRMTIFPTAP